MSDKIDLFDFLHHISKGDLVYLQSLSDADKKSLAPLLMMRWLSGTNDGKQIRYLNHLVNPLVFNLWQHPDLLYKLMMVSCHTPSKRFSYPKRAKVETRPMSIDVITRVYKCNVREARQYFPLLTTEDIVEMAEMLGEDKEFVKKLAKE
jgi:hypothetical protein